MTLYRGPGGTGSATSDADTTLYQDFLNQTIAARDAALAAETAAELAETNAETAETNAETAQANAETAQSNAEAAQAAAEAAQAAAEAVYDDFDDRYLGAKSSNPTVDNDGDALVTGALYFNTTVPEIRVYTGSDWADFSAGAAVSSFNTRTGAVTLTDTDVNTALGYTAANNSSVLLNSNNLSDLIDASAARTNLGLGTAATTASTAYATAAQGTNADTAYGWGNHASAGYAADNVVVKLTGNQTIGGTKTFTSTISSSITGNAGTVTNGVYTTGDQTIAGTKTFSSPVTLSAGTAAAPALTTSGDTNTGIFFPAADTIAFAEGGVESMRIDSSGNLGLGVTPSAWAIRASQVASTSLSSDSNDAYLTANGFFDGSWKYINTDFASQYYQVNGVHAWRIAPSGTAGNIITFTQAMTLDASGNLGIGTNSPDCRLSVSDSNNNLQMRIGSLTAGRDPLIRIQGKNAANTINRYVDLKLDSDTGVFTITAPDNNAPDINALNIDSSGNVGIGTSSPVTPLQVSHSVSGASYGFRIQNTSTTTGSRSGLQFQVSNGTGGGWLYVDSAISGDSPYDVHLGSSQGGASLVFETGGTEKARLTSNGYIRMASGSLGIQFNGDTSSANALDDYEEGTWTPVIADATTGGNTGSATVSGANYTKIGRQVTVSAVLTNIVTTGMTAGNALYVRGLPFTSLSTNSSTGAALSDSVAYAASRTFLTASIGGSDAWLIFISSGTGLTDANTLVSNITSGSSDINFTITYFV